MAICIINRPDPGEKLGNNQGIQGILDLNFNTYLPTSFSQTQASKEKKNKERKKREINYVPWNASLAEKKKS